MILHREELKSKVIKHNKSMGCHMHSPKSNLFHSYICLIQSQIQHKLFEKAFKTCKQLRIHSLNSLNPYDVLKSLEVEGYKTHFPKSNFNIQGDKFLLHMKSNKKHQNTHGNLKH